MGQWADGPTKDLHGLPSIFRPDSVFFRLFGHPKNHPKNHPLKKSTFLASLEIFGMFSTNF